MDNLQNYMFFQNLEQLCRDVDKLKSLDKGIVDSIINDGHDWAAEHITTAKDDVEEVTNFLLSKVNGKPYEDNVDEYGTIRRTFSENIDPSELEWHRDRKDRVVIVLEDSDWSIQFDNELPKKLRVDEEIFIPKNSFHRVIKGSTDLMVEIVETEFEEDEFIFEDEYEVYEVIEEGKKKKKKKKDACYYKVKSRYDVWPSAYASGALVKCRKVGAKNWGNKTDESELNEKTDYSKEKDKGLHGWFERQGGKGKSKGWVDCNTCKKDSKTGKKKCKPCGRKEGEDRAKYPACRPTPSACGTKGKGEKWGKKSKKNENLQNSEKNHIFAEKENMKDIILTKLHENTQPAVKPEVKPAERKAPLRERTWKPKRRTKKTPAKMSK